MNRNELKEILVAMAKEDLSEGSDLHDHPCSVAIRAIDQCFDDINTLRGTIGTKAKNKPKKIQMLVGLNYNPTW